MKIVYLAAGAGDMVCGSCLHDNTLCAALLDAGEDVLLAPLYTPLYTDEPSVSQDRLFFGGINVFLQQHSALFRHTPWWLDRLLDHRALIDRVARRAASTDPARLGALTVSMLRGNAGRQKKELDKLCDWLAREVQPDVVHLSNALLSGMAQVLRQRLGVPVVCSLSGEDIFVERVPAPYYEQVRALLRENCRQMDALVAMNDYYADFMSDYLKLDRSRIEVIPLGLRLDGFSERQSRPSSDRVIIGFLARICHDKGLHLLVDAVGRLVRRRDLPPVELKVAGYLAKSEEPYLAEVMRNVEQGGLRECFEYLGELDRPQKLEFLASLDVFSLPTVYRESKGLPALEALASGVPVVLPSHGSFPEMIESTGGGLLCQPDNPVSLAETLAGLVGDSSRREAFGRSGQQAVGQRHRADQMAERTLELYRRVTA